MAPEAQSPARIPEIAMTKKPFVAPTLKSEASLTEITLSGQPN